MSILEAAETGMKFRCVEFGIVVAGCLNVIGIPTRVLALKTRGSELSRDGAGHVQAEAYPQSLNNWVLVDPQWKLIDDGAKMSYSRFKSGSSS